MLTVEGISAGYGERDVIRDLSFSVKENEVYVLLGGKRFGKNHDL